LFFVAFLLLYQLVDTSLPC